MHLWEQNLVAHAESEFFRVSLSNNSLSQGLLQFRQIGIPSDVVAYENHHVYLNISEVIQLIEIFGIGLFMFEDYIPVWIFGLGFGVILFISLVKKRTLMVAYLH